MTTCIDTGHITLRSGIRRYSGLVRAREHLKLRILAWVNGEATDGWIRFLNSDPFFAGMATACPRLIHKIYRPYVTATLTSRQRVSALVDHYSFVRRMGWTSLVSAAPRPVRYPAQTPAGEADRSPRPCARLPPDAPRRQP
jgi:uncharacterized protein